MNSNSRNEMVNDILISTDLISIHGWLPLSQKDSKLLMEVSGF